MGYSFVSQKGEDGVYAKAIKGLHRAYKLTLSPYLGQSCRFLPTCSDYMSDALLIHGPVKGLGLGLKRFCRCHPGGGHGYDPVPDFKSGSD